MLHLLFDYGGVIVDLDRQRCIRAFDALAFDIRPYIGTFKQRGPFAQLDAGTISIPDFCAEIRRLAQRADLTDAAIVRAWEAYLVGVPTERLSLLRRIARQYPLALLSNTNAIHWEQSLRDFFTAEGRTVVDYFEPRFLSYELHLQKPDPAIFHHVVAAMGCPAQDILFLDDSEENCAVARSCGLRALLAPEGGAWMSYFDAEGRLVAAL